MCPYFTIIKFEAYKKKNLTIEKAMKGYNFSFTNIYFINKPVFWSFKISSMSTGLHSSFPLKNLITDYSFERPCHIHFVQITLFNKKYIIQNNKEYILRIRPPTLLS